MVKNDSNTAGLFGQEAYGDAKPAGKEETDKEKRLLPQENVVASIHIVDDLHPAEEIDTNDMEDHKDPELFETPVKALNPEEWIKKYMNGNPDVTLKVVRQTAQEKYEEDLLINIMKVRGQIAYIMANSEDATNSDDILERLLDIEFYGITASTTLGEYWGRDDIPTRDTIKRERALWNSKGYFLPTDPKVLEKRGRLEVVHHNLYAK